MRQLVGPGRNMGSTMPADWLYLLTQYFGLNMESLCKVALKIKWKLVAHLASCTIWANHKSSVGIVVLTVIVRSPHTGQTVQFCLTLVSKSGASLSSKSMMEWWEDFGITCQGPHYLDKIYCYMLLYILIISHYISLIYSVNYLCLLHHFAKEYQETAHLSTGLGNHRVPNLRLIIFLF